jgi:nicotinamide-nucleotide amidase
MSSERPLQIEICSVGTEIAMGRIQDTNSSWIARRAASLGAFIKRITIVPDDENDIVEVFGSVLGRRPDALIISGGMGPTDDDLTVGCVARLLGVPMVEDADTIERFIKRRNVQERSGLNPGAIKMAMVPEGAEVGENPVGWAPALHLRCDGTDIFVLPGPPKEMVGTFDAHVMPVLAQRAHRRTHCIRLAVEMFESEVAPLMVAVQDGQHGVYMKAFVALRSGPEDFLPVDLVATGESQQEAECLSHDAMCAFTGMVEAKGKRWRLMDES